MDTCLILYHKCIYTHNYFLLIKIKFKNSSKILLWKIIINRENVYVQNINFVSY